MLREGHLGLALLVLSLIALPIGFGPGYSVLLTIVVGAALSPLPDIDVSTGMAHHRGITHSILFALIIGGGLAVVFEYAIGFPGVLIGFLSGFSGIMLHLLGDVFTRHKFKPFYPYSDRLVGLGWFSTYSKIMNKGFFASGCLAFVFYVLVSSGTL